MFQTPATLRAPMAPRFRLASLFGARVSQQARIEALRPVNQTRLFEALGEAGITHLTVIFTGLGAAARIDSIAPWAGSLAVELPVARLGHAKGSTREIRSYAPQDQTLHGIAGRLQAAQRQNFYQLHAEATHRGRYYHEYCMSIDVSRDSPTGQPPAEGSEETVVEALRDLARWLYRQLEAEYDHLTSDEAVEDGIVVNEYTFTDAGRRFG